jgi:hypothetical protein
MIIMPDEYNWSEACDVTVAVLARAGHQRAIDEAERRGLEFR